VLEHYQAARLCLEVCSGCPFCDVMLMMALTLESWSAMPFVDPRRGISMLRPRKVPAMLAANLLTRMLLVPSSSIFPVGRGRRECAPGVGDDEEER
jgi:hypothetical protein